MLTYTFTRREKVLLLVLAIIVVVIAWYVLVFQNTTNQITRLEGEIATTESEVTIEQARVNQLNSMRNTIEQRKSEGVAPTIMPEFDNMQQLMSELNVIMRATDAYTLTFDELNTENAERVERGVRVDYSVGSYRSAEAIVDSLAKGTYPCRIDSVAFSDVTTRSTRANSTGSTEVSMVNASVHVTFFEKVPAGMAVGEETGTAGTSAGSATN